MQHAVKRKQNMSRPRWAVIVLAAAVSLLLLIGCSIDTDDDAVSNTVPTVETSVTFEVRGFSLDGTAAPESKEPEAESSKYIHSEEIPLSYALQEVMQQSCKEYDVPYPLALAIAEQESGFDVTADNGMCYGIMQIHSIHYENLRSLGIEPTVPKGNISAGVFMIGKLLDKYGDTNKALMAYNCGEAGASRLWKQGYRSSEYARQVIFLAEKWKNVIKK